MFAIRHKRVPNVWLGNKFYKRGDDFYPIATKLNPSSLKDEEYLYKDDGEYFNDTDYNEHTLLDIINNKLVSEVDEDDYMEYTYNRLGILPEPNFVPEDWEVVKLSLSVEPIGGAS